MGFKLAALLTKCSDADVLNKLSGSPQLKYTLTNAQGSSLANVDSQGEPELSFQFSLQEALVYDPLTCMLGTIGSAWEQRGLGGRQACGGYALLTTESPLHINNCSHVRPWLPNRQVRKAS